MIYIVHTVDVPRFQICPFQSGTRETITLTASGNAAGQLLPPHFIFKGKTKMALQSLDTENVQDGSLLSVSPTGWKRQVKLFLAI